MVARNSPSLSRFLQSRQHRTEPLIARLNLTRAPPITDSARSDSMRNACYSVRPAKPGARAHTCISFLLCDEYALSRVLWFPLCWFFCRAILFLELLKLYKTDRIPSMGPAKRLQMTPARAITYVFLSCSSSFSFFCTTCRRPYRHCARRPWRRIKGRQRRQWWTTPPAGWTESMQHFQVRRTLALDRARAATRTKDGVTVWTRALRQATAASRTRWPGHRI